MMLEEGLFERYKPAMVFGLVGAIALVGDAQDDELALPPRDAATGHQLAGEVQPSSEQCVLTADRQEQQRVKEDDDRGCPADRVGGPADQDERGGQSGRADADLRVAAVAEAIAEVLVRRDGVDRSR